MPRKLRRAYSVPSIPSDINLIRMKNEKKVLEKTRQRFRILKDTQRNAKSVFNFMYTQNQKRIHGLECEFENLQLDFWHIGSDTHKRKDEQNVQMLQELCSLQKLIVEDCKKEREKKELVNQQITLYYQLIHMLEQYRSTLPYYTQIIKKIQTSEDILEEQHHKLGMKLYANTNLRSDILVHVNFRKLFLTQYFQMDTAIINLRAQIKRVVADTLQNFQHRTDVLTKLQQRRDLDERERARFYLKHGDIIMSIMHDTRKTRRLEIISQDREGPAAAKREEKFLEAIDNKINDLAQQLQYYTDLWEKVQEMGGGNDVNKIILNFEQTDRATMGLYKFVNNQSKDIETMSNEIDQLKKNIAELGQEQRVEKTRMKNLMDTMESRCRNTETTASLYEEQVISIAKALGEVCSFLKSMYTELRIPKRFLESPFSMDVGAKGVRTVSIMEYLKALNVQLNDFLNLFDFLKYKAITEEEKFKILVKQSIKHKKSALNVMVKKRRDKISHPSVKIPEAPDLREENAFPGDEIDDTYPVDLEDVRRKVLDDYDQGKYVPLFMRTITNNWQSKVLEKAEEKTAKDKAAKDKAAKDKKKGFGSMRESVGTNVHFDPLKQQRESKASTVSAHAAEAAGSQKTDQQLPAIHPARTASTKPPDTQTTDSSSEEMKTDTTLSSESKTPAVLPPIKEETSKLLATKDKSSVKKPPMPSPKGPGIKGKSLWKQAPKITTKAKIVAQLSPPKEATKSPKPLMSKTAQKVASSKTSPTKTVMTKVSTKETHSKQATTKSPSAKQSQRKQSPKKN